MKVKEPETAATCVCLQANAVENQGTNNLQEPIILHGWFLVFLPVVVGLLHSTGFINLSIRSAARGSEKPVR